MTRRAETPAEREARELVRAREARIQAMTDTGNIVNAAAREQVAAELDAFGTGDQG